MLSSHKTEKKILYEEPKCILAFFIIVLNTDKSIDRLASITKTVHSGLTEFRVQALVFFFCFCSYLLIFRTHFPMSTLTSLLIRYKTHWNRTRTSHIRSCWLSGGRKRIRKPQLASHLSPALNKEGPYEDQLKTALNSWPEEQEIVPHNINFVIVVCVCWSILCFCSAVDVHLGLVSNISQQPKWLRGTMWPTLYSKCFSIIIFSLVVRVILVKRFHGLWTVMSIWVFFQGNQTINYESIITIHFWGTAFLKVDICFSYIYIYTLMYIYKLHL